jgi:hypothetical protein
MRSAFRFGLLAVALLLPNSAGAQPVASERASLSQTVDGTTITIDYARPRIRGRGEAFGDIVHIGEHRWTPGANWATMITSNTPFTMNGTEVPDGTWSVWIDLEEDSWTLVLDPEDSLFHTFPPEDSDEQIRFAVEPREGPFVESLSFWIPTTRLSGFDLLYNTATTEIPFEIGVEPTFSTSVAEAVGRELEGNYVFAFQPTDESTGDEPWLQPVPFQVSWTQDHVEVVSMWSGTDDPLNAWLLPLGGDWYQIAWAEDGEVWEVFGFWTLEVVRDEQGQVTGFDVREEDDALAATIRLDEARR